MKKISVFAGLFISVMISYSCSEKHSGENADYAPDTTTISPLPPSDDPLDSVTEGGVRYETTDKPGTGPDSLSR